MEVSSPPNLVGGSKTKGEVAEVDPRNPSLDAQGAYPKKIPEGNTYLGLLQLSTNLMTPDCSVT